MRILSYNIQAAVNSNSYFSYFYRCYRQCLPGKAKQRTLYRIAEYIRNFDVVCLQEIDLGGLRNAFQNHAEQLSIISGFPYYLSQTNRKVGKLSLHGNVILSKTPLTEQLNAPLPAKIPGRGVLAAGVESPWGALSIVNIHLSLGTTDQEEQLRFICKQMQTQQNVLITGDFNCTATAPPLRLLTEYGYHRLGKDEPTFPSWKPQKTFDHAFLKGDVYGSCRVSQYKDSDHLPLIIELAPQSEEKRTNPH